MTFSTKRYFQLAGLLCVLLLGMFGHRLWRLALIGSAYKAKMLCSGVFVSNRQSKSLLSEDLVVDGLSILEYFDTAIDYDARAVTAGVFGLAQRKAIFREGLGCTLIIGHSESRLRGSLGPIEHRASSRSSRQVWLGEEGLSTDDIVREVDTKKLREVVNEAFSEPDPERRRRTRAVVVVYKGQIIAERYAAGFSADTPLLGWSMTKSVMNALVGALLEQGRLSLEDQDLWPGWREPNDPRRDISLDQLLRMTSGLRFDEDYDDPLKDVTYMLLGTGDVAGFAADKPLDSEPGIKWSYSSGTTSILAGILREVVGGTEADYLAFPRTVLFDRIGMTSAVMEPDAAGTFIASSFMYATARDWARLGLLYLRDGVWDGVRIFPDGWVDYTVTPAPQAPNSEYGAHVWLDIPAPFRSNTRPRPSLRQDAYFMAGTEGQLVSIVPSRNLVVVRLGLSRKEGAWDHDTFLADILEAF
ncbi:MAG: beta-lactamase family protein [Gammaproteobacteria bacterium]|nr:beta-lactamase family protein [Gammaproteobacteria bacterium]